MATSRSMATPTTPRSVRPDHLPTGSPERRAADAGFDVSCPTRGGPTTTTDRDEPSARPGCTRFMPIATTLP